LASIKHFTIFSYSNVHVSLVTEIMYQKRLTSTIMFDLKHNVFILFYLAFGFICFLPKLFFWVYSLYRLKITFLLLTLSCMFQSDRTLIGRKVDRSHGNVIFCQSEKTIFHLFHFIRKPPKNYYFLGKKYQIKV
jgi:hypothetical protein